MSTDLSLPVEEPSFESLPLDQQLAITALAEGCTLTESAERAGVAPVTLWRWRKSDPGFAAVYNAWKQDLAEAARAKLLKSADIAATTVINALSTDPKLSLSLLKNLGVLNPSRPE